MARSSASDHDKRPDSLVRITPPFVGRRRQLKWLEHCLHEAVDGHPRVALISGAAGIGKTRLLKEVQSMAVEHAVLVCYGRCYEDLALPYLPFVEVLRSQLKQMPEDVERSFGAEVKVISQFLRGDQSTLPRLRPAISDQSEQEKLQLLMAVAHTTVGLAQSCPTLLTLDDLHWADALSLDLLGHLVFTVADTAGREPVPLLILGTYRPEEREEHLVRLTARIQREDICQTVVLPGLDESEMYELIRGLGLARPSHQLVATMHAATQGNPLFVQEMVHHLRQQGALQERGGYVVATSSPTDLQLPEQVTGVIAARAQGLSKNAQHILTLASFLGEHFSLRILSAVSRMGEEEVLDLLEAGIRQHVLLSEGQTFQFAHPLIRRVFYSQLMAARQQRVHQQIAQTLEELYADSLEAHVMAIAHHLVRAGPAADREKVRQFARQAGDQAFALSNWSEAARYYEALLLAVESTGVLSIQEKAALHYRTGLAYYRDQDVGPCLDHYEKAIAAYRMTDDIQGLAQALIAKTRTHYTLASVPSGTLVDVQPLEEVLRVLGENEPELRGNIAAVMAEAYRTAGQPGRAEEMAQRALEIGQRIKDDWLCAYASFALAMAQTAGMQGREALESWQNALALARRADDRLLQGWSLQRLPLLLILQGCLHEAEVAALEACDLARQTHDWSGYSVALSALASVALAKGDFEAVAQHTDDTLKMVYRSRYPWGGRRSLFSLACAGALRGAWSDAETTLDMLVEPGRIFQDPGQVTQTFVGVFRQLLQTHAGTSSAAVEQCAADLIRIGCAESYALGPFCALVEMADLMQAPTVAAPPYQELVRATTGGILFSAGWVCLIPRVLGVGAALQRWWDKAEAHFQMAIDAATRAGARPELGRSYLDYARMLATRGGMTHRQRAAEMLTQARAIFAELGMVPFVQRAHQLAESLQSSVPVGPWRPPAEVGTVSEQEVELLLQRSRVGTSFLA
jgi:tetratricopeptide (TPR) repeat protein